MNWLKSAKAMAAFGSVISLSGISLSLISCHKNKSGQFTSFNDFADYVESKTETQMWNQISSGLKNHSMTNINIENPDSNYLKLLSAKYSDNSKDTVYLTLVFKPIGTVIVNYQETITLTMKYHSDMSYNLNDWTLNYTFEDWMKDASLTSNSAKILQPDQRFVYSTHNSVFPLNNKTAVGVKSENPSIQMGHSKNNTYRFMIGTINYPTLDKNKKTQLFGNRGQAASNWWSWSKDDNGASNYSAWKNSWHSALLNNTAGKYTINQTAASDLITLFNKTHPGNTLIRNWITRGSKAAELSLSTQAQHIPNDGDQWIDGKANWAGEIDINFSGSAHNDDFLGIEAIFQGSWTTYDSTQFNVLIPDNTK